MSNFFLPLALLSDYIFSLAFRKYWVLARYIFVLKCSVPWLIEENSLEVVLRPCSMIYLFSFQKFLTLKIHPTLVRNISFKSTSFLFYFLLFWFSCISLLQIALEDIVHQSLRDFANCDDKSNHTLLWDIIFLLDESEQLWIQSSESEHKRTDIEDLRK